VVSFLSWDVRSRDRVTGPARDTRDTHVFEDAASDVSNRHGENWTVNEWRRVEGGMNEYRPRGGKG